MNVLMTDGSDPELDKFCIENILQVTFCTVLPLDTTWWDILVEAGIFKSKSQARKNWKGSKEVSPGFHQIVAGKKRIEICVHRVIL